MDFIKRTWAEIDLNALDFTTKSIKSKLKENELVMGIVKADAYGHGDGFVARRLQDVHGYDWFGVSNIEEAISLRRERIVKPILILGYTPISATPLMKEYNLTQALIGMEFANALQAEAEKAGIVVDVHIKLDTGMSRVGFPVNEDFFEQSISDMIAVSKMPNLRIGGIFTHFAVADGYQGDNPEFTEKQFARYNKTITALVEAGVSVGICHCANSAATIAYPEKHLAMCRPGIISYGLIPSDECIGMAEVQPVMSLKTSIGLVKKIKAGSQVSYGRTYTAPEDRVIATIPLGYADGFPRCLSNKGRMLVGGQFVPIIGRVCMDQIMLDVTDVPNVKMGDEVVVFGRQGDNAIYVEELAEMAGTITHEIVCGIAKRVPRVYIDGGNVVGIVNHVMHRYE